MVSIKSQLKAQIKATKKAGRLPKPKAMSTQASNPITIEQLDLITQDEQLQTRYKVICLLMFFGVSKVSQVISLRWGSISADPALDPKAEASDYAAFTRADGVVIALPEVLQDLLSSYWNEQGSPDDDAPMFPSTKQTSTKRDHISRQIVNRALVQSAERLGIDKTFISAESFRKGWVAQTFEDVQQGKADLTLEYICKLSGHKGTHSLQNYIAVSA